MATGLNPNKTDFSMSLGLSAHVVYVWGQYGPVIFSGVIHFKPPLFGFSLFISFQRSRGKDSSALNDEKNMRLYFGSQLFSEDENKYAAVSWVEQKCLK